ncbi:MAG: type II secretion system F family protein [Bacteroidetes bacterium]|nr:MAG: type II secretion system F family protein [Bacteroidota bacterium]
MATVREFKFIGTGRNGQPVQGTVFAPSRRAAQKKIEALAEKHGFRPREIQQRQVYLYKVRHPNGKVVTGEQKAFSAEELEAALRKMGVEVLKVEKKLFNIQRKPPRQDMIMFVRLAANLLKEKLPFDEVLNLLVNDVSSSSLKQVIRDLNADLKGGMEAQQAFMKHQHMLGKFTAYMLGIASRSGNMSEIYEATARFLERQNEFKKSVRSAMVTPAITLVVLIGAFIWYVWYIFPQTAGLFEKFGVKLPPLTAATLEFSKWMDQNYAWLFISLTSVTAALLYFLRTPRGRFLAHKYMIRIPVIGSLLHKLNIEIFCRVFGVLYSGSGDNINVIKIAAEACGNAYMEHRIKTVTVPMMVAQGADLVRAMEASGVFTQMALARFRSGAETGNVRASALQMADYYEKETTLKLRSAVETIQTVVAIIITIAIVFLTIISSEISLVQPSSNDIMNARRR